MLNAEVISSELGIDSGNVNRSVRPLIGAGILTRSESRRNQIWRSAQVLGALDAFAARAGRRAVPT